MKQRQDVDSDAASAALRYGPEKLVGRKNWILRVVNEERRKFRVSEKDRRRRNPHHSSQKSLNTDDVLSYLELMCCMFFLGFGQYLH